MVWGSNPGGGFSLSIWTGPGAHPASYIMGTVSFGGGGGERLRCGIDHPSPSSTEVKKRVELYMYSLSVPSWPVLG